MKKDVRGVCLVINNINFECGLKTRRGAEVDTVRLKKVFALLHYFVILEIDKKASEMREIFEKIRLLQNNESFVCVVMSHGGIGDVIYGVDGETITVHDITKTFNDQNCAPLRGKPKMFFISACRGGKITTIRILNIYLLIHIKVYSII